MLRRFCTSAIGAVAVLAISGSVSAGEGEKMILVPSSAAVDWQPGPPSLPEGTEIAAMSGDPGAEGPFVLRVKFPAGAVVPPHSHPTTESVTVLSGTIYHSMGETLDKDAGEEMSAGGFFHLPANMNHAVWTTSEESIVQVVGTGPFQVVYVNPADDPAKSN